MATCATASSATINRRGFLGASGGLSLAFALPMLGRPMRAEAAATAQVNAWLTVGSDNAVTLTIGASDMGQGSFQGLAQLLAEDLQVDVRRVSVAQGGPTLANPAPVGSAINTVGSSVTRSNYWRMRDAAAAAREMLVSAAMARVGDASRSSYGVLDGVVVHTPTGRRLSYGELADAAAKLAVPANAPLVPDAAFKVIGQPMPRADIPSKVDGSARYGIDVRLPGMVFAVVKHCPTFGGTLTATPSASGAIAVVPLSVSPGTGRGTELAGAVNAVAVVASTTWDAMRLARGLKPKWNLPAYASQLSDALFLAQAQALAMQATPYAAGAANGPGTLFTAEATPADPQTAFAQPGAKVLQADYVLPYLSHACMEVLNCTVDYVPGVRCDVHAPTQSARGALTLTMQLTGLREDQVKIHTTLLGGGLGRKAEQDFIGQAVQLGMALKRPVQLVWPREEDYTRDQYRPMALVRAKASVDANGYISGWSYRNVSPSILGQRGVPLGAKGDSQGTEGSHELPYTMGARRVEWVSHPSPIPVGFWRSVGASINTFAVESMIDELAAAAGKDPFEFRRARLSDPRWIAVLESAAASAGWSIGQAKGSARGIAVGAAFNTIVAMVVEVSGSSLTSFSVRRVWVAVDPYLVVNPLNVEAQIVGGVVHAMNATLYGQQNFVQGVAQRRNFNTNPMVRLRQMPQVKVTLMPPPAVADRMVPIGGIGELGVPTFAPALANALFRLTGQRVRQLPLLASSSGRG